MPRNRRHECTNWRFTSSHLSICALFGDETRVRTIRHVFVAFLWVKLSKTQCTYISLTLSYKNALRITFDLFVVGNLLYQKAGVQNAQTVERLFRCKEKESWSHTYCILYTDQGCQKYSSTKCTRMYIFLFSRKRDYSISPMITLSAFKICDSDLNSVTRLQDAAMYVYSQNGWNVNAEKKLKRFSQN